MTILSGEHYVVETIQQFVERTSFDHYDVAQAVENDERYDYDLLDSINEYYEDFDVDGPFTALRMVPEDAVREELGAQNVATYEAIIATLDADDRPWIHLFDGHVHDVVEVHTGDWLDYEISCE